MLPEARLIINPVFVQPHDHGHLPDKKAKPTTYLVKMIDLIDKGGFDDHPEVEEWLTGIDDPLTKSYKLLAENIVNAEPPNNPLTNCGDVIFKNLDYPLHFHSGIGDRQKRLLFEIIEIGLEAIHNGRINSHARKIFDKAVAVASVLLKDEINPKIFNKLSNANEEEIHQLLHNLAHEALEVFERLTNSSSYQLEEHHDHVHHHHDHEHEHHGHVCYDEKCSIEEKLLS